jgi:hypothetical protein
MKGERIAVRCERLRVLIAGIGEEPSLSMQEGFDFGFVPGGWSDYLSDEALGLEAGDVNEDVDLALECAALAQEVRARQWAALEEIDSLFHKADGRELPIGDQRDLARAIITVGWNREPI